MTGAIVASIIVAAFFGIFLAGVLRSFYVLKKGRQVDARVISCVERKVHRSEDVTDTVLYQVTVDFYDLKGETVVKELLSDTPYVSGDVIRCRYLDKKGILQIEPKEAEKISAKYDILLFLAVFLIFAVVLGLVIQARKSGGWSENTKLILGYFIGILFTGIGVLGIRSKINMTRKMQNMVSRTGVQVDYVTRYRRSSDRWVNTYSPVYEYEWGGEQKRIGSSVSASGKKYRAIGRKVHILVDPRTGEAFCQEDAKTGGNFMLFFGGVGIAILAVMLVTQFYVLPKGAAGEGGQEGNSPASSRDAEEASVLELFCTYEDMEREICCYSINLYGDGSGRLLLFPVKTVSGRVIDQKISFTVSAEDLEKVIRWVEQADVESLTPGAHRADETDAYVSLQIYEDGERYYGGGYCDEGIYADIYEMIREIVPAEAWEEMEKRETAYYQPE